MLLYSTTLRINDTLTRDGFNQLVIQWNQSSHHEDNVITDMNWNVEYNIRTELQDELGNLMGVQVGILDFHDSEFFQEHLLG